MPPISSRRAQKSLAISYKIKQVVFGNLLFDTWYDPLYPAELVSQDTDTLYVCSWCFRYTCDKNAYVGHVRVCPQRSSPPGTRIYDDDGYSVWEVDGEADKLFAQNLSLFAKLFLEQKSVCFDVSGFLFYLLVYIDADNPTPHRILGFFSKEKMSWDANNLACILIFPPYQHRQLGKFLMGISYRLSTWEYENRGGTIGGPERPLSDMGERSYIRFWEERIARYFLGNVPGIGAATNGVRAKKKKRKAITREEMTVEEIGKATGMLSEDVVTAIKAMGIATEQKLKKPRKKSPLPGNIEVEEDSLAIIKKSSVLEFVKQRGIPLEDPVKEEAFLGKWAHKDVSERSDAE